MENRDEIAVANEWELSKENVQPLKHGRKFANLTAALQPNSSDQQARLREEKQTFEADIRTYSGDDPFSVWDRYIKWIEQNFPKGGKECNLSSILEQCLAMFKDDDRYKNDERYIEAWIKFSNYCNDSLAIYQFLFDQDIGTQVALFYEAWAWELERINSTKKADAVFNEGKKRGAQPVDSLMRQHSEFQARVARRAAGELVDPPEETPGEQRSTLAQLRASKKGRVASNRGPGFQKQSSRGLGLKPQPLQQKGQSFKIFDEENIAPSVLAEQTGEWQKLAPQKEFNKENSQKAGVWKSAKVSQSGVAAVPVSAINRNTSQNFKVHIDENFDVPMVTPKKQPEINQLVLSSRKPEKPSDPLQNINRYGNTSEPGFRPMYCKHKVYAGADEFSFEELRAARMRAKNRFKEEKLMEEQKRQLVEQQRELARQAEEMRQQQLEVQRQREEFRAEQERLARERQRMIAEQEEREREWQKQKIIEAQKMPLQASFNQSTHTPVGTSFNVSANSSSSRPRSSGPTPDSGRLRQPNCRQSLAAPSPTVNTREAMQAVLGMFSDPLADIENDFGWSQNCSSTNAFEAEVQPQDKDVQAAAPFTIYDESSAVPKENNGFQIFVDENDENTPPEGYSNGAKRKNLAGVLQPSSDIPISPVEKQDDAQDEEMDGIEALPINDHDDFTFGPHGGASFAAVARLASTPFNPLSEHAPLPAPPLSTIKPAAESRMEITEEVENEPKMVPLASHSLESFETTVPSEPVKSGLSPIMERSDEKSNSSSGTSSTVTSSRLTGPVEPADSVEPDNNQTMHHIDVSLYIPVHVDELVENILSTSVAVDPQDPFDEHIVANFLSTLSRPLSTHPLYCEVDEPLPQMKAGIAVTLGAELYTVECLLGEGGFAKVYQASMLDTNDLSDLEGSDDKMALKVQSPGCPWEFYICTELQRRLTEANPLIDVRDSLMQIEQAYFYQNGSCLVTRLCQQGTLLNLVNLHKENTGGLMSEALTMYLTIEMLKIVEQLHHCQVIHGDIKPDNFLLCDLPEVGKSSDPVEVFGTSTKCLRLIDFGRSIDMTMFPPGTTFTAKVNTSGFQCIEMKTNRPWTYQTDLFGLAGSVHVMIFGTYMNVYCQNGEWKTTGKIKRWWNEKLWNRLFHELLNIPSCDQLPDVTALRKDFESYFMEKNLSSYNTCRGSTKVMMLESQK